MTYFEPLDIANRAEYIALFEKMLGYDLEYYSQEITAKLPELKGKALKAEVNSQLEDLRRNSYQLQMTDWINGTCQPTAFNKFIRFDKIRAIDGLMLIVGLKPLSYESVEGFTELWTEPEYDITSFPNTHTYARHLLDKFIDQFEFSSVADDEVTEELTWETPFKRLDGLSICNVSGYFSVLDAPVISPASPSKLKWIEKHAPGQSGYASAVYFDLRKRLDNLLIISEVWDSGEHPDRIPLDYILKWVTKKQFRCSWTHYIDEQHFASNISHKESPVRKITDAREFALQGWLTGKGYSAKHKFKNRSQEDIWGELGNIDPNLFPPRCLKSIQAFFQKQDLCSFTLGRKKIKY